MEFRLIYEGQLRSESYEDRASTGSGAYGRARDKQILRKHFHPQLKELWQQHPALRMQGFSKYVKQPDGTYLPTCGPVVGTLATATGLGKFYIEYIADDHVACAGNRFVPLISYAGGFTCSLDILFLRRDNPGNLIDSGGDIDNRIKVLLDGLRMPKQVAELGGIAVESDENPFHVLLEDDKLITRISVTTDRLIKPLERQEQVHDVLLLIHVTVVNPSQVFAGNRMI